MSILSLKYFDLLTYLGLTNVQLTIIAIITILLTFIICFIIKLGFFQKVQIYRDTRNQMHIIYRSYQGSYQNILTQFNIINCHMEGLFTISRTFGIYYDDPQKVQDKNLCRAIIGIMVNQGQKDKTSLFTDNYPDYKEAYLPKSKFLAAQFPYLNNLTFFLLKYKVYPKFEQKHKQHKKEGFEQKIQMIIQIYHFLSWQNKRIEILAPLQHFQQFFLWEESKKSV